MKALLVLLNLLLVGGIGWQAFALLNGPGEEITITTKDRSQRSAAKNESQNMDENAPDMESVLSGIAAQNIFDATRCPEAMSGSGSSALILLGVYRMGDLQGAIFQQRQQPRVRQMGPFRNTQPVKQVPLKRFLKLGDSLENGYTLTAVYDDHIVLSNSGSSMELYIQRPSTYLPSSVAARNAAARRSRPNAQQMQTGMMARQVRLLEQMSRTLQSSSRRTGSANRSTRSR